MCENMTEESTHINPDRFDKFVKDLLQKCPNISTVNCNKCENRCALYDELCSQHIEDTPQIMNVLRMIFLNEIVKRVNAMKTCPRYPELNEQEFYEILSNQKYYKQDGIGNLIAIF